MKTCKTLAEKNEGEKGERGMSKEMLVLELGLIGEGKVRCAIDEATRFSFRFRLVKDYLQCGYYEQYTRIVVDHDETPCDEKLFSLILVAFCVRAFEYLRDQQTKAEREGVCIARGAP